LGTSDISFYFFPGKAKDEIDNSVSNLRFSLKNRILITKAMSVIASGDCFISNQSDNSKKMFWFCDFEYLIKIPNKKYSFSTKVINVMGSKQYYAANNSPVYQAFYSVPLTKWNILFKFQYDI
jgi:hypothetical protein